MMKTGAIGHSPRLFFHLFAAFAILAAPRLPAEDTGKKPLLIGVDANYSLDMEKNGAEWKWGGKPSDLFEGMAKQGITGFRVRLWTKEDGPHGKTYATDVVRRALRAGLDPYLVIFLSDDWSDMMKQPVPAAWKDLSFEERAAAVETYSRDIVMHFRREGLKNHVYEIGNEIDYGICGEYPGKSTKKNPESLSRRLWPRSAQLILASQAGVRTADPEAKFLLHIAHWWDAEFCAAFFRFMLDQGVQVDYAGLSYFPSSNIGGSLAMDEFGATVSKLSKAIGRPVIVPETAYPGTRDFKGQFSRWKYEVLGYPMTPEGQRRWISDFLAYCGHHPDIHAVYYWSPEWFGEGMWKGFALFDPDGEARPAWSAFARPSWQGKPPLDPVYVEAAANTFHEVPVEEAKARMTPLIEQLRKQTGGVTTEHIALLTNTVLKVGPYTVDLKGSLQQNLNMKLSGEEQGVPLSGGNPAAVTDAVQAIAARIDPLKQKLVLITRNEPTPDLDQAVAFFASRGIRVDRHPKFDDLPLKFGMCGAFDQSEDASPGGATAPD